jgi:hypothetical protein
MRVLIAVAGLLLCAAPARAELSGPSVPPPPGCQAVALGAALAASGPVCVHRVLVQSTDNESEQNSTSLTVTDHDATVAARIGNWWPQGAPQAGMVVTLWVRSAGDHLIVDRWIDLAHGRGPAPAEGPYPSASELDVDTGRVPNNRTVWVPAITFLLDPQDGGDGDVHVQTMWPCPAAGLTTESTPVMRGYVDHPAIPGLTSSSDTTDDPHNHLADDPPVGVPVMILGQIRVDYGFGWYELHPIRAWRPMTPDDLAAAGAGCAADPVPHLDRGPTYAGTRVPVPFGVPPCTDGSEFGSPPGFGICSAPYCYVSHTEVGRPETLAGPCERATPQVTASQEGLPERLPGSGLEAVPSSALSHDGEEVVESERERFRHAGSPVAAAYGPGCRAAEVRGAQVARCADAVAHLASGERLSAAAACRRVSAPQRAGCRRAALRFLRSLSALRGRG